MTPRWPAPAVGPLVLAAACTMRQTPSVPSPPMEPAPPRLVVESVLVRNPELEQRLAHLELAVLEKDAQVEDLQARLDEARREVVRAMAKLQTLASRADAASAIAEAEIALRGVGGTAVGEGEASQLLEMSAAEFRKHNFGGAVYLANQAKGLARRTGGRVGGEAGTLRPGEVLFAVPVPLHAATVCNVRVGPGTTFPVVFTAERGTPLMAYSHSGEWLRVTDERGRSGWVHQTLVGKRPRAAP